MKTSAERMLLLGFAASVLAMAVMGWLSYRTTTNLIAAEKQVSHTHEVIAALEAGRAILTDAETKQRGFLLTGDEQFLKDCREAQSQINGWMESLRKLTADNPEQQQRLDKLGPLISQRLAVLNGRIQLRQEQGLQAIAGDTITLRGGKELMDQVWQEIAEMHEVEDRLLLQRQQAAQASAQTGLFIILAGSALACAVGLVAVLVIGRDLKLRRFAEDTLRQSEERLRLMIETVKDYAIILLDPEGRVVSWNEGAQRIKGYTASEIIGRHFSRFYPDEVARSGFPEQELKQAVAEGRVESDGWRVRKDGSQFWANVVITAVRDHNGRLRGFTKVTRDVTERKKADAQITRLNLDLQSHARQLETANHQLESFSYSVSHDLRAPLRHIDGFVKMLEKQAGEKLDERGHRYLGIIADSARQMGALIDDLLVFSRMSRTELRRSRVAMASLVHEAVDTAQMDTHHRRIDWKIGWLPEVEGDAAMLRQVWVNLIANAVKYSRPRDPAEIEIGCNAGNGELILFVRDNGVGFDMQYVNKLFGVFQRLHHSDEFEGTGIGLANVRRIVSRHGGRTWAEGKVDGGATFFFSLPKTSIETKGQHVSLETHPAG